MNAPPDSVLAAALYTLHRALVHARNVTHQPGADAAKQINELADAVHEMPNFLIHGPQHSLEELRLHLACFQPQPWPGAPDLVAIFEEKLAELTRAA